MVKEVKITTEYITLGQMLKFVGKIDSGFLAKLYLSDHFALVNGEKEQRRGKKLYRGDHIVIENEEFLIE